MGEHLPCKQGVMGSNPIISTNSPEGEKEDLREENRNDSFNEYGLIAQLVRARA